MRVARESRGYDPRWLWQAKGFAASAGALFIRSYERGERVYLAMIVARATTGRLPEVDEGRASTAQWAARLACRPRRPWSACSRGRCGREPRTGARGLAARLRLPRRHPGAVRRRSHDRGRRACRAPGSERRRQDDARAAPERHQHGPARLGARGRAAGHEGAHRRRSGAASASCSRTPTTSCSCPPSATTWRSGRRTWACGATTSTRASSARSQAVGMEGFIDRPPHHLSFGQRRRVAVATVLAMRTRDPGARRAVVEPGPRRPARARRHPSLVCDITMLMVTHDLPYALELCPRAVVINEGVIVADGRTRRHPGRRSADGGQPPGAALRLLPRSARSTTRRRRRRTRTGP